MFGLIKIAKSATDLLLPQVGGNARKTNYDYTGGQLDDLIKVIIEEKAALFVCAVGVPPRQVVDALHKGEFPLLIFGITESVCEQLVFLS